VPEHVTVIVRLAPEWEQPVTRALCMELETISRQVPAEVVIHAGRNLIFRHRVGDEEVAVKRFPVSGGRRLVYRLRASKAVRAFDHASRLITLGIGTPRPLAAVEVWQGRALLTSFYCCAFVSAFREARALKRSETPDRATLLESLGEFIGRLHESGALHRDLTSGNVLLVADRDQPEAVTFQLVDLNRMSFGRVGARAGLANLAQLRLHDGGALLRGYCRARGLAVSRAARYYHFRLGLRSVRQALKERTRPWRRRLGL
jgi:aminoglycoside phosphotransferase (APT) family kinase protein